MTPLDLMTSWWSQYYRFRGQSHVTWLYASVFIGHVFEIRDRGMTRMLVESVRVLVCRRRVSYKMTHVTTHVTTRWINQLHAMVSDPTNVTSDVFAAAVLPKSVSTFRSDDSNSVCTARSWCIALCHRRMVFCLFCCRHAEQHVTVGGRQYIAPNSTSFKTEHDDKIGFIA